MNRYKVLKTIGDGTYGSVLKGEFSGHGARGACGLTAVVVGVWRMHSVLGEQRSL